MTPTCHGGVRILYGSEMGNGEYLAEDLAAALSEHDIATVVLSLDEQPVDQLNQAGIALIIVSTYGEGEMPYGAETFWENLDAADAPACPNLHYAVLALGDSSYTYFCEAGILIDTRLTELGATRLGERVDCDADYHAAADTWITARVAQLRQVFHDSHETEAAPEPVRSPQPHQSGTDAPTAPLRWTRENPFTATLARSVLLSSAGSDKEVRHYELDLRGIGTEPRPGDSIAIIARNDPFAVERFLGAAGVPGWRAFHGLSYGFLARERWELRYPSAALLTEIGARAPGSVLGSLVTAGDRAAIEQWARGHSVADALAELRTRIPADRLGELMGPIRYRAYSLASSPLTHPGSAHLTVATQRLPPGRAMRSGVASGFLADDVSPGEQVRVFPLPNRSFHLPDDDDASIIMIGPGVGVAPFRAFVQERQQRRACGAAWLFFGDRHQATDFLYRDEWEHALTSGALTRLTTAFSRDQEQKIYVQDRMREHAADLTQWLQRGAYLYVCGDAQHMARDVEEALRDILHTQLGAQAGSGLLTQLHQQQRYQRDVY